MLIYISVPSLFPIEKKPAAYYIFLTYVKVCQIIYVCMYWRKKPQLEIFFGEMKNGSIIPFIKNTISKNLNGTQVIVIAQGHLAIMPCYAH